MFVSVSKRGEDEILCSLDPKKLAIASLQENIAASVVFKLSDLCGQRVRETWGRREIKFCNRQEIRFSRK